MSRVCSAARLSFIHSQRHLYTFYIFYKKLRFCLVRIFLQTTHLMMSRTLRCRKAFNMSVVFFLLGIDNDHCCLFI